jgi:cytochrome c553
MKKRAFVILILAALPFGLEARGVAQAGQQKAKVCETCHGLTGKSIDPNYPNLAGQHESYLVKALSDYRSGRRKNAVMSSFTGALSNQDIEDLASWYASQEGLEDLSIK